MSALDERIKYYRARIINRLKGYEGDIGPTFRLYIDTVMECENLEELKEMAELDLQLDYFNYIRSINDKLQIFGVSLDDIKRENDKNIPKDSNEITEMLKDITDEDIAALDDSDETYSDEYMDGASEADALMSQLGMIDMYTSGDDESLDGIEGLPSELEDDTTEDADDEEDEYFDVEYETEEEGSITDEEDDDDEGYFDGIEVEEEKPLDISDDAEIDLGLDDDEEEISTDSEDIDDYEEDEGDDYFSETEVEDEYGFDEEDEGDDDYFGDSEVVAFVEEETDESIGGETSEEDDEFLSDFEDYIPDTDENSEENEEDLYFGDETEEFDEYSLGEEDDDDDYFGDNFDEETVDSEEDDEEDDYFDTDYATEEDDSEEFEDDDEFDDEYFESIDESMEDDEFADSFEDDASEDDDLFFGELDDTESEEGDDFEDEDDDLFFGEIDDDEGTIEDELNRQIAEFESGAMDDDDIFGGLDDGSDTGAYEMSPTGFVKGSIFDQYATEKGYVAFGNMKTEAMYQGIASFISKGTSKVEGEIKSKFGKFFDLG